MDTEPAYADFQESALPVEKSGYKWMCSSGAPVRSPLTGTFACQGLFLPSLLWKLLEVRDKGQISLSPQGSPQIRGVQHMLIELLGRGQRTP